MPSLGSPPHDGERGEGRRQRGDETDGDVQGFTTSRQIQRHKVGVNTGTSDSFNEIRSAPAARNLSDRMSSDPESTLWVSHIPVREAAYPGGGCKSVSGFLWSSVHTAECSLRQACSHRRAHTLISTSQCFNSQEAFVKNGRGRSLVCASKTASD